MRGMRSKGWDVEAEDVSGEEPGSPWSRRPTTAPPGDYVEYQASHSHRQRPVPVPRSRQSAQGPKPPSASFEDEMSDGSASRHLSGSRSSVHTSSPTPLPPNTPSGTESEDPDGSMRELHRLRPKPRARARRSNPEEPQVEPDLEADETSREPSIHSVQSDQSLHHPSSKTTSATLLLQTTSNELSQQPENYWSSLFFKPPSQRSAEELAEWANLSYTPSSAPVPLLEKLGDQTRPRYPQDEGLFIGDPITISKYNKNRLERRIVRENSLAWFGQNGELRTLANPYREEPLQLFYDEQMEEQFKQRHLRFTPARLDPFQVIQLDPNMKYEVVVDIGSLTFSHHALFSKEHVLAAKLDALFTQYSNRQEESLVERCENKLVALREALVHSRRGRDELFGRMEAGDRLDSGELDMLKQLRARVGRYGREMRRARLQRDQSAWDDRAALASVLHAWKELKQLRAQQEYTNTLLKLNIITLQQDFEGDKREWLARIEEELVDLRGEYLEEYEEGMRKYRAEMKSWLGTRRQAKEAKAERPYSGGQGGHEGSSGEESGRSGDSQLSLTHKPLPPPKFDPVKTREDISKRFHELRRLPGEPKLVLELVRTTPITPTSQLPKGSSGEERRRKAVAGTRVELRISLNRKEIYRTKAQELVGDFCVFFGLTIPIGLKEWPERMSVDIWENASRHIASIHVPLPNSKTTIDRCSLKRLRFQSEEVIRLSHAGVGTGLDFDISGNEYVGLYGGGVVTVKIGWSVDREQKVLCPKGFEKLYRDQEQIQAGGDNFPNSSQSGQLDPNDPLYMQWLDSITKTRQEKKDGRTSGSEAKSDQFSLDKHMEEFEFCTDENIRQSRRLRLLYLRHEEVPEFRNIRMIPAHEELIPADTFTTYEWRLAEDLGKRFGVSEARKNRKRLIEEETRDETDRLERVREMRLGVLKLFENSLKQITFEDLVVEEQIPDIGTLGLNLMTLFQPKRPLRPVRKERKRIQGTTLIDTKIHLIINIVRAFNLPLRKETEVGVLTTESMTGIPLRSKRGVTASNPSTVKPFVEIWFQRNVCRTTTGLGGNPTWNQELQLPLTAENEDYSQANLSRMDDFVYLHVYDEVGIDLLEDERRRETDIHQRLEKRWLGSITIPFSTLYTNGRIEGTFQLNSPPILLGYEAQGMVAQLGPSLLNRPPTNLNLSKQSGLGFQMANQKNTFITLFITLQPSLTPSSALKEDCATGETAEMTNHVKSWQNSIRAKFPTRIIKPFVMSPDGDTVLCIRYLKPIQPPTTLLQEDVSLIQTMEELAHYVSLFPSVRDATLGIFDYSLWFTSDVFVMTPGGGVEDHAVLLAAFFLHLEIPTWILQGNAIPNGPTTYVLTSFRRMVSESRVGKGLKNAVLIWNPSTAEYFNANDTFCSLDKVWAAIGKNNIWANVSPFERPDQLEWDIEKSSQWTPLFSKPLAEGKLPSLQSGTIRYKDADQVQANSLAQRIERHLKDAFMKWRKSTKTHWNRHCSAILRRLLPRLEERKQRGPNGCDAGQADHELSITIHSNSPATLYDEHFMELREITSAYQMTGFPLQQAYINLESVTERIFATGVQTIDTPDVEFALAAFAHSYPASVYSLWIYIAALHRHK